MTSLGPDAAVGQVQVRNAVLVLACVTASITLLRVLLGSSVELADLGRLAIVVLACVPVYQGRLSTRWILTLMSGGFAAFAIQQAFMADWRPVWRCAFALLGVWILPSLHTLYFSAPARAYFAAVAASPPSARRDA